MRHHLHFIFALCLVVAAAAVASSGCNQSSGSAGQQQQQQSDAKQTASQPNAAAPVSANNAAAAPNASAFNACSLLTSDDIKAVQGEAVKESKPSRRDGTTFDVASCFYTTPTFTKSVSLEVTRQGTSRQSVHEFWEERVEKSGEEAEREREAERARERKGETKSEREREREEEREREAKTPRRLKGIGDEAYWVNTNANSTMYVFKKDTLIRISIGGADKEEERMKKIKSLAERALARL
ncbi:MAG TPA: hypothetical protein VGX24_11080 [Pyrinomonadaceae bacterium]|nr:hypothetical protein [Pyrinomonadaceae bacterium]